MKEVNDMITNSKMLRFINHKDPKGSLVAVEAMQDIPFQVNRIYYIYGVSESARRGFHSHRDLEQVLICVHGSVKIQIKTPAESEDILLDDPTKALYIGPMLWREMYDFSSDAVLLVLASRYYDESDYIRDYNVYEREARTYFNIENVCGGMV